MLNQIYSYLGSELQSNYEKYEKTSKQQNLVWSWSFSKKQHAFIPYSPKLNVPHSSCLAKNDHLKTILWSIQIQMVMKTM